MTLAAGAPDAVALIDAATGERVSYAALASRTAAAGAALAARARGGLAFAFVGNDLASIVDVLGALDAGVPIALFDRGLDRAAATALVARYRPEVIVGAPDLGEAGEGGIAPHPALALLLSTSGSTGSHKLVRLSRAAVIANARAIATALALGPGAIAPTSLPLHYSYGLSVVTSHLAAGGTVVVTSDGVVSDGFWRACRDHAVTSFAGVPYAYQLLRRLELDRLAPSSLRWLTQAGGAMTPALVAHYHAIAAARGGGLYVMYGQTEACARIAVLPPSELPARAGAVGRAVADTAIAIEDNGVAVAPGEIGEVIVRGPGVMLGYADTRDDLARGDEQGGVLATGDLGRLDADGVLWLTGRTRRFAKVFGVRVSLDDIEALAAAALTTAPPLAAVAAGERIKLVIEGEVDAAALGRALAERTGLHPSGFAVVTVAALPRLATGKPDYPRIEAA